MSGGVAAHFRLWLRAGMTGCEFARLLPGKAGKVAIEVHVDPELPPTSWLNSALDEHAKFERSVIAVFPTITTEDAFVDFLNNLGADDRWSIRRRKATSPSGDVLIGLEWTTSAGDISETMGLAPFTSMPVTRRSPYIAIATWPGGRSNPLRGQGPTPAGRPGEVSFLDTSHGLAITTYD